MIGYPRIPSIDRGRPPCRELLYSLLDTRTPQPHSCSAALGGIFEIGWGLEGGIFEIGWGLEGVYLR